MQNIRCAHGVVVYIQGLCVIKKVSQMVSFFGTQGYDFNVPEPLQL